MNNTMQNFATRDAAPGRRAKWFAAAGLALSLTVPLSASASHDGDAAINLLVGATVAYALIEAVDGFDNDRNRRHDGDRRGGHRGDRHDDADRYFRSDYRHRDKHRRQYRHQQRHHQARHDARHHRAQGLRHGYRHGYRHGFQRAHGYQPRTYAPHWYAHR